MHVAFTEDQQELRSGVRDALATLPLENPDPEAAADLAWQRLAALGLPGALLPEADGGLGLDEVDLVGCLIEAGRAALPVPVAEAVLVAPTLLAGTERAPELAAGSLRLTATLDGSGLAGWGSWADGVLVLDTSNGPGASPAASGAPASGAAVRLAAAGEPVTSTDPGRPLSRVTPGEGPVVCGDPVRIARARRAGALGTAAVLIGLAERALELTVSYVLERRQFGVPIGSFQALKHQLADAHVAVELARPLVWAAAWAQAHDDDLTAATVERDVAAAKLRAGDAAALVARVALQCHGATGYTREHALHRWILRIWALRPAWGDPAAQNELLAAEIGLTGREPVS